MVAILYPLIDLVSFFPVDQLQRSLTVAGIILPSLVIATGPMMKLNRVSFCLPNHYPAVICCLKGCVFNIQRN